VCLKTAVIGKTSYLKLDKVTQDKFL